MIRRYRISGRVQGVGFRAYVWRAGQQLALTGWVRNRLDGTVEVLAEADEGGHEDLLRYLNQGPRWSHVAGIETTDDSSDQHLNPGFEIRSDK